MNEHQANTKIQSSDSPPGTLENAAVHVDNSDESRPFLISIDDDKLKVRLSFQFDNNDPIVSKDQILSEIRALGIDEQCLEPAKIEEAFATQSENPVCVASGIPPVHGSDTEFEHLIDNRENLTPKADELGNVNHKDVLDFPVVEIGTPLLRRVPGKRAVDGSDVFGEVILAEQGADRELGALGEGTRFCDKDQNLILADIKGHPVYSEDSVYVDPVLRLPAIDLKSGDINFEGSIHVSGDVSPGYCVCATGDVTIGGMVERAKIVAGQDIHIQGGVIGSQVEHEPEGDHDSEQDSDKELTAVLEAGGSIDAKFLTMCSATADKDIQIADSVVQSRLKALGDLTIGNGSGKGTLVGGHCEISHFASICIIGSDANVRTTLTVGELGSLSELHESLKNEFNEKMDQLLQLSKIHKQLKQSSGAGASEQVKERLTKIANTIDSHRQSVDELTSEMTELTARMKEAGHASLEVNKKVHPNVSLSINNATEIVREPKSAGTYQAKGKKIELQKEES